jgi:hypothetical protein
MASHFNALGIAFEAPIYDQSVFSVAVELTPPEGATITPDYHPDIDHKVLNVYSAGPLPTYLEQEAATNVRFPTHQTVVQLPTPYHTFCYIAAGCVNDDRFDHLCGSTVGMDDYKEYFQAWDRNRD